MSAKRANPSIEAAPYERADNRIDHLTVQLVRAQKKRWVSAAHARGITLAELVRRAVEVELQVSTTTDRLATLLALLVQAVPHVPAPLADEIRTALAGTAG